MQILHLEILLTSVLGTERCKVSGLLLTPTHLLVLVSVKGLSGCKTVLLFPSFLLEVRAPARTQPPPPPPLWRMIWEPFGRAGDVVYAV